jgi:hypothetical protein
LVMAKEEPHVTTRAPSAIQSFVVARGVMMSRFLMVSQYTVNDLFRSGTLKS